MSDVTRVEEIFLNAVGRQNSAERMAYLDAQCGQDTELRRRVEVLLAAEPKVGGFLEPQADLTGAYQPKPTKPEATAAVGDRIGPYKLLEKIGEGGMGEVWVADQLEPIKRRVAMKLIKPGMDSRSVLGRFEAERQALAVMDHPNIAKVLDAGTSADGRPYFVMELVKGTPITEFADARKLTTQQRLELFVPVCQAIQHAHMKGIIHRDIKPSNVLVALHDETPVPKVIDFGVAKAVGQQLTENTIYTGFGALVGTPTYMAPEQATFNQLDVDTRADVYALGVLLYELLAGSPPIEKERLKKAALDEVLRIVRDEEPPRPSARLSTSQAKASIAATRGSEPAKLSALMKGELDWIVMKALEKDRTRRYETANGFAADVQRYLAGEQVQAVPPSLGYRLRKAYRRNRAAVLVGSGFALMLLAGLAVASVLAIQARRAEAVAEDKRREAERSTDALSKVSKSYLDAAVTAEIQNCSARLDADLLEYKSDARVGLLRLARPLKDSVGPLKLSVVDFLGGEYWQFFDDNPEFVKLRQFQVAAVIAAGQEFVPLVPPLEGDDVKTSPDGHWCIAGTEKRGLDLLSIPSLTRRGVLREGNERVLEYGFSPDSQTAWTQDTDSIVRFWNTDGTLRAKTPLRPERFVYPAGMTFRGLQLSKDATEKPNDVVVMNGVAIAHSQHPVWESVPDREWMVRKKGTTARNGPTDLYSTRTGQFIRRLDRPGWKLSDIRLAAGDRWLIYHEQSETAEAKVIVSAAEGRELSRLSQHGLEPVKTYAKVSPTGKWVMTDWAGKNVRLWNTENWKPDEETLRLLKLEPRFKWFNFDFVTDDVIHLGTDGAESKHFGILSISRPGLRASGASIGSSPVIGYGTPIVSELGGSLIRCGRVLTDANTFQRLNPPPGRKYALELTKIAPDGRFFENLDTITEKELPQSEATLGSWGHYQGGHYHSGYGRILIADFGGDDLNGSITHRTWGGPQLRMIPDAKRLNINPKMLELWAQVIVGGELSPEGTFQPWDQPTWAAKQCELAAMKPPYADFPFPSWAATEPHLWHGIRGYDSRNLTERDKYLKEWQRLSGRTRPDLGPDTWRTPEVAPKPEPKK